KTHVSWSPTARCTSVAATAESTPPERAQMTRPPPTCARMLSVASAMNEPGVHVGVHLQTPKRKLRSTSRPLGVWTTSGWNWMPRTGTPDRRASGWTCGAPASYTLAGPPLRIRPEGFRFSSSDQGVVPGTSSQYTFASRTRRAMSWLNWEPKSRTNTVCRRAVFSVASRLTAAVWLRLLAHAHVLGL